MESYLLPILISTSLTLAMVPSHAALPSEVHWNSVLPNTPMPETIKGMLQPAADSSDEKGTSVGVGNKGGVSVSTGYGKGKPGAVVGVGKGGVSVGTDHNGKPAYVGVVPGEPNPFHYMYAATEDQLHDNPDAALFFLEKALRPGTQMKLHFTKPTNQAPFLPRKIADSMPFSSNKMAEILKRFSAKPKSVEAESMKNTVKECEEPSMEGEDKYCATSLEAMVDFSTSKLGNSLQTVSTERVGKETRMQEYTITKGVKKMGGKEAVVCHKQSYPYAVFYCHSTKATRAFEVPLVGADGSKLKAAAVCHTDTSSWNPKHLAFQVLKVKPGTVPICHFLPEGHIVWTKA